MHIFSDRRRFIELLPFIGISLLTACSPKPEPAPAPAATPPAPPAPPAAPAPSAPLSSPASTEITAPKSPPVSPATTMMLLVDEKDAQAVSLGYVADTARADKVKYKTYIAGSQCSGCSLYLEKAGDSDGGCPLFQGKKVTSNGWCSAWVKKA